MAPSRLGGPGRAAGLQRRPGVAAVAVSKAASPAEIALAWLLDISAAVVPIPGARTPEHVHSPVRPTTITLRAADQSRLHQAVGTGGRPRRWPAPASWTAPP